MVIQIPVCSVIESVWLLDIGVAIGKTEYAHNEEWSFAFLDPLMLA